MIPFKTPECNFAYFVNPVDGKGQMDCIKTADSVTSFWKLERSDPLYESGGIYIHYLHGFDPLTFLGFGNTIEDAALRLAPLMLYQGEYQTNVQLNDAVREWLNDGGCFVLQTFAVPPPPVCVWLA